MTADFAAMESDGYATWPEDYDPVWSRLTFLPGETRKTVALTIKRDAIDEPDDSIDSTCAES